MLYQAQCQIIGCGWKGTKLSGRDAMLKAFTEADAHVAAAVESLAPGVRQFHVVEVKTIHSDSPEFEARPPAKEIVK